MVAFHCPHCGEDRYSAWPQSTEKEIVCDACGKVFDNPHYKGREKSDVDISDPLREQGVPKQ